jgi:hypothetical protein
MIAHVSLFHGWMILISRAEKSEFAAKGGIHERRNCSRHAATNHLSQIFDLNLIMLQ